MTRPEGDAAFSRCGRYRWWLRRQWRQEAPALLFIGLNPSKADGRRDDPTLRRLIGFADGWGYGAVEVVNLFAWISADPLDLRQAAEPVGRRTDLWIRQRVRRLLLQHAKGLEPILLDSSALHAQAAQSRASAATGIARATLTSSGARPEGGGQPGDRGSRQPNAALPLWLGWGNGGRWRGRDRQMLKLLGRLPVRLLCLGTTTSGQPRHPLYVHGSSPLRSFAASWEQACPPSAAPCPAPRAATRST